MRCSAVDGCRVPFVVHSSLKCGLVYKMDHEISLSPLSDDLNRPSMLRLKFPERNLPNRLWQIETFTISLLNVSHKLLPFWNLFYQTQCLECTLPTLLIHSVLH